MDYMCQNKTVRKLPSEKFQIRSYGKKIMLLVQKKSRDVPQKILFLGNCSSGLDCRSEINVGEISPPPPGISPSLKD